MPSSIDRPGDDEFHPYYSPYVNIVPRGNVVATLENDLADITALLVNVPEDRGTYRYAPGKWSVKDVVNHIIDAERIFAYRALRIGRGDPTPLATFHDDTYARAAQADRRPMAELATELTAVRHGTLTLLRSLSPDAMALRGTASGYPVTPRAIAFIIAGHARHHVKVLQERYGVR